MLAHLNNSVLEPQVTNLEAALDQARADADLAEAEYQRARAVGSSGALSAEETQRRKSTAVTAAAHVKVAAAMLAEGQARLARADVRAPANGIILTRSVEVGQTAMPGGEALVSLIQGWRDGVARPGGRTGSAAAQGGSARGRETHRDVEGLSRPHSAAGRRH